MIGGVLRNAVPFGQETAESGGFLARPIARNSGQGHSDGVVGACCTRAGGRGPNRYPSTGGRAGLTLGLPPAFSHGNLENILYGQILAQNTALRGALFSGRVKRGTCHLVKRRFLQHRARRYSCQNASNRGVSRWAGPLWPLGLRLRLQAVAKPRWSNLSLAPVAAYWGPPCWMLTQPQAPWLGRLPMSPIASATQTNADTLFISGHAVKAIPTHPFGVVCAHKPYTKIWGIEHEHGKTTGSRSDLRRAFGLYGSAGNVQPILFQPVLRAASRHGLSRAHATPVARSVLLTRANRAARIPAGGAVLRFDLSKKRDSACSTRS